MCHCLSQDMNIKVRCEPSTTPAYPNMIPCLGIAIAHSPVSHSVRTGRRACNVNDSQEMQHIKTWILYWKALAFVLAKWRGKT